MTSMEPAALEAFLRETRIAKLAYLHANGSPTIVPIWFEWDASPPRRHPEPASPWPTP